MSRPSLGLYESFARLPRPRSYVGKLLVVALACVNTPLLVLVAYMVTSHQPWAQAWPPLLAALLATLGGAAAVSWLLYGLLAPVRHATDALEAYTRDGALPALPTHHADMAGRLLGSTHATLTQLDGQIQLRSRLLSVLSHDLRTPLTTIQLAADLMTEELDADVLDRALLAELASTIHTSVQHASGLTTSLLDSAQQSATLALRPERVTTADVLARVAANVRFIARRKGVDVKVVDAAEETLFVDRSKLLQVLGNFATNAIKFTPPGGRVTLTAHAEGEAFVLAVRDTGTGFDPASKPRLFEPFGEVRADGTDGEGGHGLGLWIAQTFAERLGGAVRADSEPGEGSVFALVLPRTATARACSLPMAA